METHAGVQNRSGQIVQYSDKSIEALAETLGGSCSNLTRWRREFGPDPDQALLANHQRKEQDEEVSRLQKALKEAQDEIPVQRGSPC